MNFFFENLSLLPETRQVMEHFKLVFGSGNSSPAKIRPLKNWPPPFPGSHRLLGTSITTIPPGSLAHEANGSTHNKRQYQPLGSNRQYTCKISSGSMVPCCEFELSTHHQFYRSASLQTPAIVANELISASIAPSSSISGGFFGISMRSVQKSSPNLLQKPILMEPSLI